MVDKAFFPGGGYLRAGLVDKRHEFVPPERDTRSRSCVSCSKASSSSKIEKTTAIRQQIGVIMVVYTLPETNIFAPEKW